MSAIPEPAFDFPLNAYFERIEAPFSEQSLPPPTLDTLNTLIHLHLHHVPFSSLDAFYGVVPSIRVEDVFEKIVVQKRGGWCFEQNTLFHFMLEKLGYEVKFGIGRITFGTRARNHCFNFVKVGSQLHFVDVGLGVFCARGAIPIPESFLEAREQGTVSEDLMSEVTYDNFTCRIVVARDNEFAYHGFQYQVFSSPPPTEEVDARDEIRWELKDTYEYIPKLAFSLENVFYPIDYEMANLHTALLNEFFVKYIMLNLTRENGGFFLLFKRVLTTFDGEHQTNETIETVERLVEILEGIFHIHLESYEPLQRLFEDTDN